VVFPEADLKIFMTADPLVRAQRRQIELMGKGDVLDIEEILENIKKRDIIDSTRAESPLKQADDAVVIDTTYMTLDEQVDQVILLADAVINPAWHSAGSAIFEDGGPFNKTIDLRHRGKANFLFLDGHVEASGEYSKKPEYFYRN
jgi:prepilin-type processing-associated H-X9-DG protein